jgi:hypothetical protein
MQDYETLEARFAEFGSVLGILENCRTQVLTGPQFVGEHEGNDEKTYYPRK